METNNKVYLTILGEELNKLSTIHGENRTIRFLKGILNYVETGEAPKYKEEGDRLMWMEMEPYYSEKRKKSIANKRNSKYGIMGREYGIQGKQYGIKGGRPRKGETKEEYRERKTTLSSIETEAQKITPRTITSEMAKKMYTPATIEVIKPEDIGLTKQDILSEVGVSQSPITAFDVKEAARRAKHIYDLTENYQNQNVKVQVVEELKWLNNYFKKNNKDIDRFTEWFTKGFYKTFKDFGINKRKLAGDIDGTKSTKQPQTVHHYQPKNLEDRIVSNMPVYI